MRDEGARVYEGDPRYPTLVRGFNLRWAGRPRYVALCRHAGDVARELQAAVDANLRVTVRSGGHCYEGFSVENEGGVILDTSAMSAVYRDPESGLYAIEAGSLLWNAYLTLFRHYDVTLPGGSCYSVGAGGHVLGGGYGPLSRLHGLTVDYLDAVEVVHVTANRRVEVVTARRDAKDPTERDLLWAHQGGGGGNFGVATRLWFRDLPKAPTEAHQFKLTYRWDDLDEASFARLVGAYGTFFAEHGAPDSPYAGLMTSLDINHRSAGQFEIVGQYVGGRPDLVDDFILAVGEKAKTIEVRELPWLFAAQTGNASGPNRRGKYKSAFMNGPFPEREIDVMWKAMTDPGFHNPSATLSVVSFGGRVNAVAPTATAFAHRSSVMLLQYLVFWEDPAEEAENLRWIRGFYDAMYGPHGPVPDGIHDGCFVNYPDRDLPNAQALYFKENYPRLQAVKGRWDPLGVFGHAQSVAMPRVVEIG